MKYVLLVVIPLALSTVQGCPLTIPNPSDSGARADGAYPLRIDLSGSLQNPAFSPDGKSILFTRFRDGYNKGASDLFIYHIDTETLDTLVSNGDSNVNLPGSVWNSAVGTITFSSERETHDEIFVISASGSNGDEEQITNRQDKQSFEPSFSPDGQWVVFESHDIDVENNGAVTIYKTDGSTAYVDLTTSDQNAKQPNWSPLGDRILYQKEENGRWSIWTMDIEGKNSMLITRSDESDTDAVFSQDGQWVIFSSENDNVEVANIYKVPSLGGASIRLTTYTGYDGAPSISPDGKKIAFESRDSDPEGSDGTTLWLKEVGSR